MTIDCIILVTIRYIPILPPSEHWAYLASLDKELLRARELLLPQRHLIFVGRQIRHVQLPRCISPGKIGKSSGGNTISVGFYENLSFWVVLSTYIYMHVYVHIVSV
jgi:hypothetical protein